MRVNELAKELGKTSKEVLSILQRQNQDVKSHSSNISEDQIQMVRHAVSGNISESAGTQAGAAKPEGSPAGAAPKKKIAAVYRPQNSQQRSSRPRPQQTRDMGKTSGSGRISGQASVNAQPSEKTQARPITSQREERQPVSVSGSERRESPVQVQAEKVAAASIQGSSEKTPASVQSQGAEKTQTASTQKKENVPTVQASVQNSGAGRPQAEQRAPKLQTISLQSQARPQGQGAEQSGREGRAQSGSRDGGRGQGSRDGRNQNANRDGGRNQGGQGYGANRDGARAQGGNRDGARSQGSRDGGRNQGSQNYGVGRGGNRDGAKTSGYSGNRDGGRGQGGQSYGGNRDSGRSQGGQSYGGNRDGGRNQGGQSYGGNRDGGRSQGGQSYGGNRDGGRGQGGQSYGGNRDGGRSQGGQSYGGNRDGGRGQGSYGTGRSGAARSGQRDASSKSFDSSIQTKPSSRQNKNNHRNDRYDKKNVNEDGPRSKGGKVSKHPFIMPQKTVQKQEEEVVKVITIPEILTIRELAEKMKLQPSAIVKKLFLKGQIVTLNTEIDFEKAEEIAMDYEVLCEKEEKVDVIAELLKEDEDNEEDMITRPPVVCVMGHVDHGKTSLLDAIRSTNVTSKEAGGITQHIGAYMVEINGQQITFLDTPGHEAFTAMRMRGAQSTDIAILVVAADDGVMPQTIEAINHAKAAEVEIIVAINKIDKPSANIERVKQELSEYELIPEDWGGSTIFVPVSAHTKEGISDLLEMILLAAEVKELKANPDRKARGIVIEAELDKGKGPVATILVQKGTLHVGDNVTAGACYGKVRAMMDDKGRRVKEAGPSQPVEILGLNDVPGAGDVLMVTDNEKEARNYAETFIAEGKNKLLEDTKSRLSLDDLFSQIKAGNIKELPIIIKADVQGSVEAVKESLVKLSNEEVMVKVIHGGVGAINESDVSLASASNAIIIGFNVRPDMTAKSIAEREKVDLRLYRVIYQAIEDVEAAMKGMLDPVFEEQIIGHAVVRQLFKASGVGTIAGSYVTDGKFQRGCSCRITRDGAQIFDGNLASLKRFKDDVKEVATGYECGLVFEKFNDLQEDDVIEAYIMVEVPR